jgi:hypothetical protein
MNQIHHDSDITPWSLLGRKFGFTGSSDLRNGDQDLVLQTACGESCLERRYDIILQTAGVPWL